MNKGFNELKNRINGCLFAFEQCVASKNLTLLVVRIIVFNKFVFYVKHIKKVKRIFLLHFSRMNHKF